MGKNSPQWQRKGKFLTNYWLLGIVQCFFIYTLIYYLELKCLIWLKLVMFKEEIIYILDSDLTNAINDY